MPTLAIKVLLDQVASYLAAQGIGTVGTNLFKGTMPDSPVKCISITASGGPRVKGDALHRPRIQISVRDISYPVGLVTTQSVFDALDHKVVILGTLHGRFRPEGEPGMFTRDVNERFVFPLNFSTVINPV